MPTTNPVPSTDPSDLLFNAGKLDEVVNGTANSFTDRLGVARRTVAGMNADFDAQLADAESDLNVYRSDAAASAAQALEYLNTIRATSYGAYASDPATDPLGNPPTVGDEYFNTTANLLKRWNGTTWQASDINTANLAAPTGASLIGTDPGPGGLWYTVQGFISKIISNAGSSVVGFIQSGVGAVNRFVSEKLLEQVSPEDFGALGWPADDTAAFNKAIDYLAANGGGVIRCVPGKTYGINASGYSTGIKLKPRVFLHNHGAKLKAISANSPDYRLVWIQEVSNCGVVGGEIEGDRSVNTATGEQGHGIYIILNCSNIIVEGVKISDCFGDGVYTGRLCTNVKITKSNITNNRRNNISVVSTSNVLIDGNEISYANGTYPEAGIDIEPNAGDAVSRNVIITNNNIYGNAQQGIDFPAPPPTPLIENAIVANNHIYNNGGAGIKASYINKITIDDNHIYGNSGGGIVDSAALATSMNIRGNTIYNNTGTAIEGFVSNANISGNTIANHPTGWGVKWKFGQRVTIAGNTISDTGEEGIYYERAYNSVIDGNTINNTQKHGIFVTGTSTSSATKSRKVAITGNSVSSPGLLADNAYSGIYLDANANTSTITGNTVSAGTAGNLPLHAIHAVDSTVFASNNHTTGGAKSGNSEVNIGGVALPSFIPSPNVMSHTYVPRLYLPGLPFVTAGAGSPEGAQSAPVGSVWLRTDGGVGTTMYVKQTGTGNTGWAAK